MKRINLYLDMEFTSLSPDAQIISLGIVSDPVKELVSREGVHCSRPIGYESKWIEKIPAKSFYAEFTDFDINRCDDWVKENVIKKLILFKVSKGLNTSFEETILAAKISTNWSKEYSNINTDPNCIQCVGNTWRIKEQLKEWLSQFSDYEIQIITDCGTWDFYHFLQLVAEWDEKHFCASLVNCEVHDGIDSGKCPVRLYKEHTKALESVRSGEPKDFFCIYKRDYKTGLPKLPSNISPAPLDLNDIISIKRGISPKEAFDINREDLAFGVPVFNIPENTQGEERVKMEEYLKYCEQRNPIEIEKVIGENNKHNSLFDAQVIKTIYNKLK